MHPVATLQTESSLWTRDVETELLPLLRELGIGFVPYSPLGHVFLTAEILSPEQLSDDDWRKTNPRFTVENFQRNLRIVDEVQAVAAEAGAGRFGLAARAGRRHRPDSRHETGRPRRGEHSRRPRDVDSQAARTTELPHASRWRAPRRGKHKVELAVCEHARRLNLPLGGVAAYCPSPICFMKVWLSQMRTSLSNLSPFQWANVAI